MLDPSRVRVRVQLPVRVREGSNLKTPSESLETLKQLGMTILAGRTEEAEEGFAFFLLPMRWSVEQRKRSEWTVITNHNGKDILFVFTSRASKQNPPYIFYCS
jgi:hypothetical protein